MKIGIEAQRIFRAKKHGMDIYALSLIRTLQKMDKYNQYFIFVKSGPDKCLEETRNFKIIEVPGYTYADWEQINLPKALKEYQIDLLHCTSNTAPIRTDVPLILTVHDIIYLNQRFSGGSLYQRLGHYYRKWIVPRVIQKAQKILTVSKFEANHIRDRFPDVIEPVPIYNGISDKFVTYEHPGDPLTRKALGLPDEYIMFLGNAAPKKNMPRLLRAYAKYRELITHPLPLVVLETGEDELKRLLHEQKLNFLKRHIYLTGYVDNQDLPALYKGASLFMYPSLRESFGIPIIESMACGTPVITSITSSMPEVGANAALYVDPENTDDIATQMANVMEDGILYARLVDLGKQRAAKFNWKKTCEETMSLYNAWHFSKMALS